MSAIPNRGCTGLQRGWISCMIPASYTSQKNKSCCVHWATAESPDCNPCRKRSYCIQCCPHCTLQAQRCCTSHRRYRRSSLCTCLQLYIRGKGNYFWRGMSLYDDIGRYRGWMQELQIIQAACPSQQVLLLPIRFPGSQDAPFAISGSEESINRAWGYFPVIR